MPGGLQTRKPVLAFALGTVLAITIAVAVSIGSAKPQTFEKTEAEAAKEVDLVVK
jgi:hypothetical protein